MNTTPTIATPLTEPSDAVQTLIAFCRENSPVCPMPQRWSALWDLLPNRTRTGAGGQPPLPLIVGAWDDTPEMLKMLRLAEQIEWAADYGGLGPVDRFLRALPEHEWFHLG